MHQLTVTYTIASDIARCLFNYSFARSSRSEGRRQIMKLMRTSFTLHSLRCIKHVTILWLNYFWLKVCWSWGKGNIHKHSCFVVTITSINTLWPSHVAHTYTWRTHSHTHTTINCTKSALFLPHSSELSSAWILHETSPSVQFHNQFYCTKAGYSTFYGGMCFCQDVKLL